MNGIHPKHLLDNVIVPVLKNLELDSRPARGLLLGTAMQESKLGFYLKQLGNGPALGIYQMEPATYVDIWESWLEFRPRLASKIKAWSVTMVYASYSAPPELVWNLAYATAMARVHYLRKPGAIPDKVEGWAEYWKQHYNSYLGKGTVAEFIAGWEQLVSTYNLEV